MSEKLNFTTHEAALQVVALLTDDEVRNLLDALIDLNRLSYNENGGWE
jgi:hypothetical protein